MLPTLITATSITVGPNTIVLGHPNWDAVLKAIKEQAWEGIAELMRPLETIKKFVAQSNDGLVIEDDSRVLYKGEEVNGLLMTRLLEMSRNNLPVNHLTALIDGIRANPSFRVQQRLYEFLEYGNLPSDADGWVYGYKVVNPEYLDKHSRSIDNSIGTKHRMARHKVDDNDQNTCSYGYHLCSKEYVKSFYSTGDHLMVVRFKPEDVVSVPVDYNNTKMRVCAYEVVAEIQEVDDPEWFGSVSLGYQSTYVEEPEDNNNDPMNHEEQSCIRHIAGKQVTFVEDIDGDFYAKWDSYVRRLYYVYDFEEAYVKFLDDYVETTWTFEADLVWLDDNGEVRRQTNKVVVNSTDDEAEDAGEAEDMAREKALDMLNEDGAKVREIRLTETEESIVV